MDPLSRSHYTLDWRDHPGDFRETEKGKVNG